MTNNFKNPPGLSSRLVQCAKCRMGIDGSNSAAAVKSIVEAEDAGVRQVWMAQLPTWPDTLTTLEQLQKKLQL